MSWGCAFDIDGMLFKFIYDFFYIFYIFFTFMLFPTFLFYKSGVQKSTKFLGGGGGGGQGVKIIFRKTLLFHFAFYAIFNIKTKWKY